MTATKLIAFHGNPAEKDAILAQLQDHYDADEIVKGIYWEYGKGCAVGCTIHSSDHAQYESRFGIPKSLAQLEDTIFESLPNGEAKTWPVRFMRAIPVGADLSSVEWQFKHRILTDAEINPGITDPSVSEVIANMAVLCERAARGDMPTDQEWSAAASAAYSAAWSAAYSKMASVLLELLAAAGPKP